MNESLLIEKVFHWLNILIGITDKISYGGCVCMQKRSLVEALDHTMRGNRILRI